MTAIDVMAFLQTAYIIIQIQIVYFRCIQYKMQANRQGCQSRRILPKNKCKNVQLFVNFV